MILEMRIMKYAALVCAFSAASLLNCLARREPYQNPVDEGNHGIRRIPSVPSGALDVNQALAQPNNVNFCVAARLVMHPPVCPPCPENARCEACMPPFSRFGTGMFFNLGEKSPTAGDEISIKDYWNHVFLVREIYDLSQTPLGTLFVLQGEWRIESSDGRIFFPDEMQLVEPEGTVGK